MRIGYFGRPIGYTGGIGRYATELLTAMARVAPENEYIVYTNRPADVPALPRGTLRRGSSKIGRVPWEQIVVSAQLRSDRPDVYHSADFTLPLLAPVKMIVTVMDLIYLRQRGGTSWRAALLYRVLTGASIRKARSVMTISEFTRQDIAAHFKIPSERISVAPPGVNPGLAGLVSDADARARIAAMGLDGPYILFVGLLTCRKGVLTLIEAFEKAQREGCVKYLVLAGGEGSDFQTIAKRIEESPVRERIRLAGRVDDNELVSLYRQAAVFCLPSFHEGYGMPAVEAMQQGCPAIVSNCTSLPEAAGDAGLLAEPGNADDWARQISRVAGDAQLTAALREKGYRHAAAMTWESSARTTLDVYAHVMEERQ